MAEHDWNALHDALTGATESYGRDELVTLLRDLIKEYVVERGLPAGAPTTTTPDLTGLDFPRLITWLKRNLSVPELALFEVDGDRVIVDADGPRVLTVDPRARGLAPPAPARPPQGPSAPRPVESRPSPPSRADDTRPETNTRAAQKAADTAAKRLSPGFRGLEFD